MTRSFLIHGVLLTTLLGSSPVAASEDAPDLSDHPFIGSAAPEFHLESVDGDSLALRDLRGKYVVLHFGTSW